MATYYGCATQENRIKWLIFCIFVTLGVVFTFSWLGVNIHTAAVYIKCLQAYDGDDWSEEQVFYLQCDNYYLNKLPALYGLQFAWIFCYVVCSIPLYIMCCCTNPPDKTDTPFNKIAMTHVATPAHAQHAHNVRPVVPIPIVQHPVNYNSLGNLGKTEHGELKPLLVPPVVD